ncbi:MAG: hypothetical protein K0R38_6454, partial [Polyangiaceae bacterium]|nr:hypothetical protein [Polyangiaceae bacterium]
MVDTKQQGPKLSYVIGASVSSFPLFTCAFTATTASGVSCRGASRGVLLHLTQAVPSAWASWPSTWAAPSGASAAGSRSVVTSRCALPRHPHSRAEHLRDRARLVEREAGSVGVEERASCDVVGEQVDEDSNLGRDELT